MRRAKLHRVQHPHVGVVLCAGFVHLIPLLGLGGERF